MNLETVPLIIGAILGLIGLALVVDSRMADKPARVERRRQGRLPRNRAGEMCIGLGMIAVGVAIAGRDSWRYALLVMLVGAGLSVIGIWLNRAYVAELVLNRGASRRRPEAEQATPAPGAPAVDQKKDRIR